MLMIDTYVAADSHGGKGLFARNFIPKGTLIWRFNPDVDIFYSMEEYKNLPQERRREIAIHVYPSILNGVQGVMYSLDNDRYLNHDLNPNVGRDPMYNLPTDGSFDSRYDDVFALRDIQADEEMTTNYYDYLPQNMPDFYSADVPVYDFMKEKPTSR